MAAVAEQEKEKIRIPEIRDFDDAGAAAEELYDSGAAVTEEPYEAGAEDPATAEDAETIDVDIDNMVWEVETEPAESARSLADSDRSYGAPYDEIDAGTGDYYSDDEDNYQEAYYDGRPEEFEEVPYARKVNKHVFTWVLSVVCGIYGVDRMVRGQVGLGVLKLLTAGGLGFWYLADAGIAIYKSYMAPDAMYQEDLHFDRWGRYV